MCRYWSRKMFKWHSAISIWNWHGQLRFTHKGAQENLTDSLKSQLIEEGDPQNLSHGSVSPLGIITSDLFLSLIFHLKKAHCQPAIACFNFDR